MLSNPYSDKTLITLFSDGDETAFALIYEEFYRQVLYFARRYVSEQDARDITADSFVKLWNKRGDFTHKKAIATFLYITTRNQCCDLIRHNRIKSKYENELLALMDDHCQSDFFLVQVRLEIAALLRSEIDKLPPKMREVVLLSFRDGLKPAQIAEKLNISVKTVSNQKLSAIKILKSALQNYPLELMFFFLPGCFLPDIVIS